MDTSIELGGNVYAVVSLYNSLIYVHIRRYVCGKYPTKDGICILPSQWKSLSNIVIQEGTTTISGMRINISSSGMRVTELHRDKEIFITTDQMNNLINRYII